MNYLFDIGVTIILAELKKAVKDPEHKRQLKNVMLKIYTKIGEAFGDDPDFK